MRKSPSSWLAHWAAVRLIIGTGFLPVPGAGEAVDPREDFVIRQWRIEHGLPSDTVQHIVQTRDGFMWFATRQGLSAFDGMEFKNYSHVNSPAFVSDDCYSLAEDSEGNLWVATEEGVLLRRNGRFKRYGKEQGLSDGRIRALLPEPGGGMWVAGHVGLNFLKEERVQQFRLAEAESLNHFRSIARAADGPPFGIVTAVGNFLEVSFARFELGSGWFSPIISGGL